MYVYSYVGTHSRGEFPGVKIFKAPGKKRKSDVDISGHKIPEIEKNCTFVSRSESFKFCKCTCLKTSFGTISIHNIQYSTNNISNSNKMNMINYKF